VGQSGKLLCGDVQRGMIERLNSRLAEKDAGGNVHSVVGDAMHLPLRAGTVDQAFLVTVRGEIPQPHAALAELRRVVAKGGAWLRSMRLSGTLTTSGSEHCARSAARRGSCSHKSPLGYTACFREP
jgi:ubiquinone/menaquinone biosynthesis C-methylase UbiE